MSSVFESYEGQFSTITADITARIGKIPNLIGSKSHKMITTKYIYTIIHIKSKNQLVYILYTCIHVVHARVHTLCGAI